jgi:acyl-CoA synthetase (AMP-forming)/AMP-acid ligase II
MLVEDLKQAMKKLGPCLVQLFGQAESPMTITYLPHGDHLPEGNADQMKRLSSAGFPRTDVEVKIFDVNDRELPPGDRVRSLPVRTWS